MSDKMEFPRTMKEFIEGYSFKDSDEVYTNGATLIPTFRVEQALEHYEKEIRKKAVGDYIRQLEAEIDSSAKFIREYDDSIAQKAYHSGLIQALKIAKQMKGDKDERKTFLL